MSMHSTIRYIAFFLAFTVPASAATNPPVKTGGIKSLAISNPPPPVAQAPERASAVGEGCFLSSPAMPDTLGPKNRFLSFSAGDPGRFQAIRVRFISLPSPFDLWNGATMWVTESHRLSETGCWQFCVGDPEFNAGTLQCDPLFMDWTQVLGSCPRDNVCDSSANLGDACSADIDCVPAVVQVFHEGIVPGALYEVQVIDSSCDINDESSYSTPLAMTTARWGDVVTNCATRPCGPPNGSVDIIDALVILEKFISDPAAPIKARADLEPACVDLVINISDVLFALAGFQGLLYPFEPSALDPCDSTCPNPLP